MVLNKLITIISTERKSHVYSVSAVKEKITQETFIQVDCRGKLTERRLLPL